MKMALLVSAILVCSVFPAASSLAAEVSPPALPGGLNGISGAHTVDGLVTQVDPDKGVVQIKTSEGTIVLYFETPDIPDLQPGDTIKVRLTPKSDGPRPDK